MSNIDKKQEDLDRRYIRMASIWAENSYCQRRKGGALIVKNNMIWFQFLCICILPHISYKVKEK